MTFILSTTFSNIFENSIFKYILRDLNPHVSRTCELKSHVSSIPPRMLKINITVIVV